MTEPNAPPVHRPLRYLVRPANDFVQLGPLTLRELVDLINDGTLTGEARVAKTNGAEPPAWAALITDPDLTPYLPAEARLNRANLGLAASPIKRVAAGAIDTAILNIVFAVSMFFTESRLVNAAMAPDDNGLNADLFLLVRAEITELFVTTLAFAALTTFYYVIFTASPWQATPGQRLMSIHVETNDGGPIFLICALQRFLLFTLSWAAIGAGLITIFTTPDHNGLHDRFSNTRVVDNAAFTSDQSL